tara:strand:- start:13049 stop:13960 length:912 start_codon:yes stop_codon:yes gene_type:complete
MFHRFCNTKKDLKIPGTITKKNFEDIIKFINPKRILSPTKWIAKVENNRLQKKDLCITFDDGLQCQKDVALPILNKYGLKAFWFIPTGSFFNKFDNNEIFINLIYNNFENFKVFFKEFKSFNKFNDKIFRSKKFFKYSKIQKKYCIYYSQEEIQYRYLRDILFSKKNFEMFNISFFLKKKIDFSKENKKIWLSKKDITNLSENNHVIGMHSFSHPPKISKLPYSKQFMEYKKNYETLSSICKKKIVSMSHPMNSYNSDTFKILKKMGIICGFKADTSNNNNQKIDLNLAIKRIDAREILDKIF